MIETYKSMEQEDDFGMYWTFTSDISAYFPTTNIVTIVKMSGNMPVERMGMAFLSILISMSNLKKCLLWMTC
ncbi:MAG: hypothetical protein IPG53_00915 [Ignavibacteriales bacterium]|nr:hypothetical protein [Ignavibacteriales bacterium]